MSSANRDFGRARDCHLALRALFIEHPAGVDDAALRKARDLCRIALSAASDDECIAHIGKLEDLAVDFFSEDGHYKYERPGLAGVAGMKLEVLRTLVAFRARIAGMEAELHPELNELRLASWREQNLPP